MWQRFSLQQATSHFRDIENELANTTQKIEGLEQKNELMATQIAMLEGELAETRAEIELARSFNAPNQGEENSCDDGGSAKDEGDSRMSIKQYGSIGGNRPTSFALQAAALSKWIFHNHSLLDLLSF